MNKVAAHFLLNHYIWDSPPNDAICRVYTELGYDVDYYAPAPTLCTPHISNVEYGAKWLVKNVFNSRWRKYDAFSCTSEDPIFVVGVLAFLHRKPIIFICDEIRSGSFVGNRPQWYKMVCRWAMRRVRLTIVNDESRIALQKDYASLAIDSDAIVYPGCFYSPPLPAEKDRQRQEWDVPQEKTVVAFSGSVYATNGIEWALKSLEKLPDVSMLIQPLALDPLTDYFLRNHRFSKQMIISDKRLTWFESWQSMGGVDIGVALYLNPGPQFQNMGISSNRLCMFLAMGVPVITTKQPSFEFVEKYDCGIMVSSSEEFVQAVKNITGRLVEMKANALRCTSEYIDCATKYENLKRRMEFHLK